MTQTNTEIAGSARFFSSLLEIEPTLNKNFVVVHVNIGFRNFRLCINIRWIDVPFLRRLG